jgi:hypothetical protein
MNEKSELLFDIPYKYSYENGNELDMDNATTVLAISVINAAELSKRYAKEIAIDFLESIRNYEHESGTTIHQDDRSSEELFDTFINPPKE